MIANGAGALLHILGVCRAAHLAQPHRIGVHFPRHAGMVGPENLDADGVRPLVERLRLLIAFPVLIQLRQVEEPAGEIGMIGGERLLSRLYGAF